MSQQHPREEEEESSGSDEPDTLGQTFVSEGFPLCFFIDKSVKKPGARAKLMSDIEDHGGSVVDADADADIVIIDDTKVDRGSRQLSYDVHRKKSMRHIYVEAMPFIQRCIRQGTVRHRVKEKQGMGGAVGRKRTEFTEYDDHQLCRHLALRIPYKEAGGRLGDNVYKELEKLAEIQPSHYDWVRRHTWQSLRQRYKTKAAYFDRRIDELVKREQPTNKQRYFRDRTFRKGRSRQIGSDDEDENEEVFEPESESEPEDGNGEALGHDEPEKNNATATHGKRRRSENQRNSLPSASPAKRQRTERQSQTTAHHPIVSQSQVEEQKAQSQSDGENDDQLHQKSSLFSEDEDYAAGPSGTQHTPFLSPTLVPRRSRSPYSAQPQTSQATLVPISSLRNRQRTPNNRPDQVDAPLRDTSPVWANEQPAVSPKALPHVRRARKTSGPNQNSPLVQEQPTEEPPALMAMVPRRARGVVRKKAVPLGSTSSVPTAIADPPYRNTRSRSRSVEPSNTSTQPPLITKARRRKGKEIAHPHLHPLEETVEEEVAEMPESAGRMLTARSGEAMEEERDVEELLVANATDISGISQYQEDTDRQTGDVSRESFNNHDRTGALSTDDGQTDMTLRRVHKLPRPQFPTSNIMPDDRPEVILEWFNAQSASSRRSSARPAFVVKSNLIRISAEGLASSSRASRSAADLDAQPSTPVRLRKRSTSSAESFPLIGTKASAMKRRIQEEEKNNPYTPPPGTRAAKHGK